MPGGETPPGFVERAFRGAIRGHVPDRRAGKLLQAEIGAGGEPHDLHVLFDERDERQKQRAIEPILVKLARRHVGGRDHHDAELEQTLEQPAEDHGVGNIGDVEFVEAEQPGLLRDGRGGKRDRILVAAFARFRLLPERVDAFVHVGHEFVEMNATLAHDRRCIEEQVHQHGLAAADVAIDV